MRMRVTVEKLERILRGENLDADEYARIRTLRLTGISVLYNGDDLDELELNFEENK